MKKYRIYLILVVSFLKCGSPEKYLTPGEQCDLLHLSIITEIDSSYGIVNKAKQKSLFNVSYLYNDSLIIDSSFFKSHNLNINSSNLHRLYRQVLSQNNKSACDDFNLIHVDEFSNKTPEFLSFSKPIKYLNYYLINFTYNSWSSGYSSFLVFKKNKAQGFRLLYRRVYSII